VELVLTVGAATAVFAGVILFLVVLLVVARRQLVPQGEVQKIFIPSACGGGGTCAMCKCQVLDGGGDILPTETGHIKIAERKENWRLACQVKVKQDMKIQLPEEIFGIKTETAPCCDAICKY